MTTTPQAAKALRALETLGAPQLTDKIRIRPNGQLDFAALSDDEVAAYMYLLRVTPILSALLAVLSIEERRRLGWQEDRKAFMVNPEGNPEFDSTLHEIYRAHAHEVILPYAEPSGNAWHPSEVVPPEIWAKVFYVGGVLDGSRLDDEEFETLRCAFDRCPGQITPPPRGADKPSLASVQSKGGNGKLH